MTELRPGAQADEENSGQRCTALRWVFRCLAAGLALAQIVVGRNTFGPDPRSYMELARAILRHDWAMATNAYWSALYPWLLAATLGIVKPALRWEFPTAHALSFPMYLAAIAAFEFFWASLLRRRNVIVRGRVQKNLPIPAAQMWVLGYSLFIWATVGDLVLLINPDLLVTTSALLAAGLLIRIEIVRMETGGGAPRSLYVWFGICLGFGYLAKAILFPMAFVFLAMMFAIPGRRLWRQGGRMALAVLIFVGIVSPEIALLSHSKGRLTFSDTGKLNLAWFNYNLPYRNWRGDQPGTGTPVHPTRKLFDHPAVYEFNGPIRSSYPPWFDPSYWNEGLSPTFHAGTVVRHALREARELGSLLLHPTAWQLGMLLIFLGSDLKETFKGIAGCWYLIATALAAFALYCLTLVQGRFLPPWEMMIWGSVLASVRLRPVTAPLCRGVSALVSLALLAAVTYLVYGESVHGFHNDASAEYVIAEGLQQMGLAPGTKVGAIGFDMDAHWGYLARLDIVAEIGTDETCLFWNEPPEVQTQVLQKFAEAGASVVVVNAGGGIRTTSRAVPFDLTGCARPGPGWRKIPGSPDQAFFLK
jgi:hypothetical protein